MSPSKLKRVFGKVLMGVMEEERISQTFLAKKVGIPKHELGEIVLGRRSIAPSKECRSLHAVVYALRLEKGLLRNSLFGILEKLCTLRRENKRRYKRLFRRGVHGVADAERLQRLLRSF